MPYVPEKQGSGTFRQLGKTMQGLSRIRAEKQHEVAKPKGRQSILPPLLTQARQAQPLSMHFESVPAGFFSL